MTGLGESFHVDKPLECFRCNEVLNMAAMVCDDGSRPEPGSVMLCFNCGYVMLLDKDSEPRAPSQREMRELQKDATVIIALMSLCQSQRELIDKLKRESYAERVKTVPGGSPPGDQTDRSAEGEPFGMSSADGVGQDTGSSDDR
jgi:hypothetical protein